MKKEKKREKVIEKKKKRRKVKQSKEIRGDYGTHLTNTAETH